MSRKKRTTPLTPIEANVEELERVCKRYGDLYHARYVSGEYVSIDEMEELEDCRQSLVTGIAAMSIVSWRDVIARAKALHLIVKDTYYGDSYELVQSLIEAISEDFRRNNQLIQRPAVA